MRKRLMIPASTAVALALGVALPAPAPADEAEETAVCVAANYCSGTYLSVASLGPASSSSGLAATGVGNSSGVVAFAVFGDATAHSMTVFVGGQPVTVPGTAVTVTGHARGEHMVSITGTTD